jgi:uncharacterized membrane protein YqjE
MRMVKVFYYLQGILSAKALVAVGARKRLHSEVYPFVSLQVMIAIEALWTLVATERSLLMRNRRMM